MNAAARIANDRALYAALIAADNVWMAALRVVYPNRTFMDIRSDNLHKGEPGTDMRAAWDAYEVTAIAYRDRE